MGMKAGKKFKDGFCTVSDIPNAKGFNDIAQYCASKGMKISSSNVRGILVSAMRKIAVTISVANALNLSDDAIDQISRNPDFQHSVAILSAECRLEKNK